DPVIRPGYMGDYDQVVADKAYFYSTWGDNRLSDAFHANQPDVPFAKIPVNWAGAAAGAAVALAPSPAPVVGNAHGVSLVEGSWDRDALGALTPDLWLTNHGAPSKKAARQPAVDVIVYDPPALA